DLIDVIREVVAGGWRCHLVAHSHGGMVLLEALNSESDIASLGLWDWRHGYLVMMGTPIMETFQTPSAARFPIRAVFALSLAACGGLAFAIVHLSFWWLPVLPGVASAAPLAWTIVASALLAILVLCSLGWIAWDLAHALGKGTSRVSAEWKRL